MQDLVTEELRLGFGKCSLQVQVPEFSSIKTADDLAGKRVVTSFEVLAGKYFSEIDDRLQLVEGNRTQIEYVGGSVEAACALGLADGIGQFRHSVKVKLLLTFEIFAVDLVGERNLFSAFEPNPHAIQNPVTQCEPLGYTQSQLFLKRKRFSSDLAYPSTLT
jgi:hypothetical protein